MARHEPRGQRSLTLLPPAPVCPVCDDDRWVHLIGPINSGRITDVPCPVCNRHPDLPPTGPTNDLRDVT